MGKDTKSLTVSPAKIKEQKSQWPFLQRRAFLGLFPLKIYFFLTFKFGWLVFHKIFTKLSVLSSSSFHLGNIPGRIFRCLNLVGNSMVRSWEENRVYFWFGQAGRRLWKDNGSVASNTRRLAWKYSLQGMSAAAFSLHFFFFFVKLQQVYGYFLKEFSAKVVSLAILRSCLRFENVPNADMMRLQTKKISSK